MTQAPHPIDTHVGNQIRIRRKLLELTQQDLARHLGLSAQQVRKYESGASRVAASRLYALAQILDVPITYFFESLPKPTTPPPAPGPADHKRETLELVRAYHRITAPDARKTLLALAEEFAASGAEVIRIEGAGPD